jgi:hypothetical protein
MGRVTINELPQIATGTPKAQFEPSSVDVAQQIATARTGGPGVEVAGASISAQGVVSMPVIPNVAGTLASIPIALSRFADNTFHGGFNFNGANYRVQAVGRDQLDITFAGGGLAEPVTVSMPAPIDPQADTMTVSLPRFWAEGWNAQGR